MGCTEITVYELSPEASNRLGGASEATMDTPVDFSIRLSKDVERLSILNRISTEGALGFSLPFTNTNDAILADYATPLTLDNRKKYYPVSVRVGGHTLQFDRMLVKGKNHRNQTWDLELRRSPDHWIELASQLKINELDYGTFVMSRSAIIANWDLPVYEGDYKDPNTGQRPYYWPLVDYGGWVDQTEVPQGAEGRFKSVAVEDFRPWLSFPYILRAGFCAIGWSLDGVILDTDWMKRLWVYALRQDYYIASKRGGRIVGRRFIRHQWTNQPGQFLTIDELIEGVVAWQIPNLYAGIENITGVALKFRFQMQGQFHNDRALPFTAIFIVYEMDDDPTDPDFTGEIIGTESLIIDFAPNEKKMVIFDQEVVLKPGQRGAIHIGTVPSTGFYVESGLHVKITPANQSLMTDDIPVVSECVSDETSVLDWLKVLVHLCNGRIETDFDTRTLTVYPNKKADVFGEVVPGFLLDEQPALDIEPLIIPTSIQAKPVRPDLKRYSRLEFASSSDAYIDSLSLTEPAHSRTLLNDVDLPNEIESDANPIVEPTLEGIPNDIASGAGNRHPLPYLPRLWDNTEGERSFAIGPRMLYAFGLIQQINPIPINATNEFTSFFLDTVPNAGNTGLIEDFGYATMLPTWEMTPAPTVNGNVVFGTEQFDLFVNFYLGLTQDSRAGTILDVLMFMRMKDYVGYDFRRLFTFKYNGIPLRVPMTGIRDFASCSEIATPVTFFVSPAETECCDLPCGCQFTTCDYYQDLGVFIRQATLNDMLITSFVVDGVELLTSPVGLGLLNIVEVNGFQYVTNLIDALNGIGAPYFSFNLSTRTHPEKGKRFFSLKKLACVPFRILITYQGVDTYLYTQAEQQTQWFTPGTWNDIGYGSGIYGEPIDCITVTEY